VEAAGGSLEAAEKANIVFVPDRPFNDLRYHLDCARLNALGWKEQVAFADGLARTVDWYKQYSGNWDDVESALVAHPRRGFSGRAWAGKIDSEKPDAVEAILKERSSGAAAGGGGGK